MNTNKRLTKRTTMLQEVSELFVTKPSNDLIVSEPEPHRK